MLPKPMYMMVGGGVVAKHYDLTTAFVEWKLQYPSPEFGYLFDPFVYLVHPDTTFTDKGVAHPAGHKPRCLGQFSPKGIKPCN